MKYTMGARPKQKKNRRVSMSLRVLPATFKAIVKQAEEIGSSRAMVVDMVFAAISKAAEETEAK